MLSVLALSLSVASLAYGKDLPESWVKPAPTKSSEDWNPPKAPFKPSPNAPLVSLGQDGKLVYKPYSDQGDTIIDFSYAGYKQSEVPIPDVPVVKTLEPPEGKATPQGKMEYPVGPDSFETIQKAINEVGAMKPDANGSRGALLLKKGTWYLSGGLSLPDGVVLRGEGDGEDGTTLLFTMPEGNGVGIQTGSGGGTTSSEWAWITGTVSQDDGGFFYLTLDDGFSFRMRTPRERFGWKLDDHVGKRAAFKFSVVEETQGLDRTLTLRKTFPYEVKDASAGEALDPDLMLPGQEEKAAGGSGPFKAFQSKIADAYVPSGARSLKVRDASGFRTGDLIAIKKTTNQKWVDDLGCGERLRHIRGGKEGAGKNPWGPMTPTHQRQVVAVDGNTLTFDVPLPQSIEDVHGGGVVEKIKPEKKASNCGVENLSIVSNYDKTQKSNSKQANYGNLKSGIVLGSTNSWVRNVSVSHVWYAAVAAHGASYSTIRDCKSLKPVGAVRGGKRYTYSIGDSKGILVYRCYAEDGRHDFAVGARTEGPNVFLETTAVRGGQSEPHHRWGVGTLYDNVTMKDGGSLAAINRGDSGSGHGWAAANTVFWNCAADTIVIVDPETTGENNFAFGFTGPLRDSYGTGGLYYANTRAGYWGTPKEGQYFGYAIMGDGHIESPDQPMPVPSLFKQQLADRIGQEKAAEVLK